MGGARWIFVIPLLLLSSYALPKDLADDAEKYLLPWNIRPEHYDLTLYTKIENFNAANEDSFVFSGISEITFLVLYGDVDEIVLHSHDTITIVSAQVVGLDLGTGLPLNYSIAIGSYDSDTQKQTFQVNPPLRNNGRYRITIYYNGQNTDSLEGFYRSSFVDSNGNTRWLLTTQFEEFGARQAYPCFDEPEYKATYTLTVHYNQTLASQGYRAFFNTFPESEEIRDGVHITTFKKTPRPISSYLIAFIVAPFSESPEPAYFNSSFFGEDGKKPLTTIGQAKFFAPTRQDLLSQVTGPAALNTMTRFTEVGFGMDKVQQAGIPDFAAGAMENYGLVTYRENAVFWNNQTGTTGQKQNVVSTITHELAHQWFGDLVTLHWWTDVWLNEGFAAFFETHAADEFREPGLDTSDWDLIGQFVSGTLQRSAFVTDARPTSRPLTAEGYRRQTINQYFDGISYDKGGSVLRMFLHTLGSDVFYSGLNRYLRSQEESIGTPEILLASWDGAIDALSPEERPDFGLSVAELLEGWHLQAGYPVVSVQRNGGVLTLTQKRFLSSSGDDSPRWNVPITYSTDLEPNFNKTSPIAILYAGSQAINITIANSSANWVVVNNQETGYYRVNYDDDNWEKLLAIINNPNTAQQIHEYNRAQILDDSNALSVSLQNDLPISRTLRLLSSLKHERSLAVWSTAIRIMNDFLKKFQFDEKVNDQLKDYFRELVEPAFSELSLYVSQTDSHARKLLRADIAEFACGMGLASCREQAQQLFLAQTYHPDVRKTVLCERVNSGDSDTWNEILELVKEESLDDAFSALLCTSQSSLIDKLLGIISRREEMISDTLAFGLLKEAMKTHPEKSKEIIETINSRSWKKLKMEKFKPMKTEAFVWLTLKGEKISVDDALVEDVVRESNEHLFWMDRKSHEVKEWLQSQSTK